MAYTTKAGTSGGNGEPILESGGLDLATTLPKKVGGSSEEPSGHVDRRLSRTRII